MTIPSVLHNEAMTLADDAWLKRQEGDFVAYKEFIRAAFEKERAAVDALTGNLNKEPTRSVLLRSAASLALECGKTREAERLVSIALAGDPPPEIAEELRDITEQIGLQRHLDTRGIVLHPNEMQVALTGNAIGFGVAESGVFLERVRDLQSLVFRTAERKANRPFRERGRVRTQINKEVELYVAAPRAGSFTVSLQLGRQEQMGLEGFGFAEGVIRELLDCIHLFQLGDVNALARQIADDAYLLNFVGLARNIAPDGDAVKAVAFTAGGQLRKREVLLTRPRDRTVKIVRSIVAEPTTKVSVQGVLKFADATKETENEIGLIDANSRRHRIVVPAGMMDDIVRPLWDVEVEVEGEKKGPFVYLTDIRPISGLPAPKDEG